MAKIAKSFKFEESTCEHLDVLISTLDTNATQLIEGIINIEYDRIMGNPEILKVISQMNELKTVMEGYSENMMTEDKKLAASRRKNARIAATKSVKK